MKDNPKALFDNIKKQNDKDFKIGPFKIGEEYTSGSVYEKNLLRKPNSFTSRAWPGLRMKVFANHYGLAYQAIAKRKQSG